MAKSKFRVRINGGPEQKIKTRTSLYSLAVGYALANLKYPRTADEKYVVEIWSKRVLPDYGPYKYLYDGYSIKQIS